MLYATGRELAEAFGIKISRWKRWSRQFLPPDPLGGYQSGYCRQYSFRDIFIVALAGHLVADFKLAVPDARKVLDDIRPWLKDAGFMEMAPNRQLLGHDASRYRLRIVARTAGVGRPVDAGCFAYLAVQLPPESSEGKDRQVVWSAGERPAELHITRTVHLTRLYRWCSRALENLRRKPSRHQATS